MEKQLKKIMNPKLFKISRILMKIGFYYTDLITDIMLLLKILEIDREEQEKSGHSSEEINAYMSGPVLILFLLLDRFFSFYDLLSSFRQMELQKLRNNMGLSHKEISEMDFIQQASNIKLSLKQRFLAILLVITYTDYLYVALLDFQELEMVMTKKQMIKLFCQNMMFFDIGISVLEYQYIMEGKIDAFVLFSMSLSCLACCYVLFCSYLKRAQEQYKFKDKEEVKFSKLPNNTKLFLAFPYTINFLKMYSHSVNDHKELFTNSYYYEQQIYKAIQSKESETVLQKEIKKKINEHKKKQNLTKIEQLYLVLNLILSVFGFCLLDMTHAWSKTAVSSLQTFQLAFLAYLPQLSVHMCLSIRNAFKFGFVSLVKQFFKELLQMFFIPLIGTMMFLCPVKTEEIPLLRKTRENWMTNFFNSLYIITFKTAYQIYCILQIETFIYDGEGIAYPYFTDYQKNNITKEESLMRVFYIIGFWCFIAQTIINFGYLLECLYYTYLVDDDKKQTVMQQVKYEKQLQEYIDQLTRQNSLSKAETPSFSPVSVKSIGCTAPKMSTDQLKSMFSQVNNQGKNPVQDDQIPIKVVKNQNSINQGDIQNNNNINNNNKNNNNNEEVSFSGRNIPKDTNPNTSRQLKMNLYEESFDSQREESENYNHNYLDENSAREHSVFYPSCSFVIPSRNSQSISFSKTYSQSQRQLVNDSQKQQEQQQKQQYIQIQQKQQYNLNNRKN